MPGNATDQPDNLRGFELLNDARYNKSTAYSDAERDALGLRGLIPPAVFTQQEQTQRVLENLRRKTSDIEKYIFLQSLANRNERLFYRVAIENIDEIMPLIYTPTVGQACQEFGQNFRQPKGLYVTHKDRGQVAQVLGNWPAESVKVVVVTDGERILGLGDLGANGMGIPIGKLSLYCALAGIRPEETLPIMLDVGTENADLLEDALYMGLRERRLRGEDYTALVDELVAAIEARYPGCLIQFEDFATPNAIALLARFRDQCLCFNDDIQGTAAVALSGVYASTRISGVPFRDLKIMFLGAGSAATGIGDLLVDALVDAGVEPDEARQRLLFIDSGGLVVAERHNELAPHKQPFAHDLAPQDFASAIATHKPHVLIGATGSPASFTEEIVGLMAANNERPTIFALSNPTARAECTAEQAYEWSDGRAIFASGSPFAPVSRGDQTFTPGQGNNAYIFPGLGLGAVAVGIRTLPAELFLTAAKSLADQVSDSQLAQGTLYPQLGDIRAVSLKIAVAVAEDAYARELASVARPADLEAFIAAQMFEPTY